MSSAGDSEIVWQAVMRRACSRRKLKLTLPCASGLDIDAESEINASLPRADVLQQMLYNQCIDAAGSKTAA